MKKLSILLVLAILGCKSKDATEKEDYSKYAQEKTIEERGQELFEGRGSCTACHQPENKVIGPSLKEIATIYRAQNASIVDFLRKRSGAIVDPAQYEAMKVNFILTDKMTDEELKAMEAYIMSH